MPTPKYKPEEYLRYIKMSKKKHLLVEGKEDKRIFNLLLDELKHKSNILARENSDIDTAEMLSFDDTPNNRERVKVICQKVQEKPDAEKLVGFVDREFEEFEYNSDIEDKLKKHEVQGRLIWSRGHSIENYFFDFLILRNSFRDLVVIDYFAQSLEIFEKIMEQTIEIACAVSLAAKELGKLQRIENIISWQTIQLTDEKIEIVIGTWQKKLSVEYGFTKEETRSFIEKYTAWHQIVKLADFQVVRWLCHGHIGMKFIWAAYSCCVYHICSNGLHGSPTTEVSRVDKIDKYTRTHVCASWWAREAISSRCDYPTEIIQLLGLF
jgi:hypothetical protein